MIWSSRVIEAEEEGEEEYGGWERVVRAVVRKSPSVRERTLALWVTVTLGCGC